MKIFINDSKLKKFIFEINNSLKISRLKDDIKKKFHINNNIQLTFNGNVLEDDSIIEDYDIQENDVITYLGEFLAGFNLL